MGVFETFKQGSTSVVGSKPVTTTQPVQSAYQRFVATTGTKPAPVVPKQNPVTKTVSTFFTSLFDTWKGTPEKFKQDITESAADIQKGDVAKGIAKAGFRTAGDALIAIFAPLSSAIGAVLQGTGTQKVIDDFGTVVADTSGITDLPAFQKYAVNHPNAGTDFERALFLLMSAGEKGQVKPTEQVKKAVETFAQKVVEKAPEQKAPTIEQGQPTRQLTQEPIRQAKEATTIPQTDYSQTALKFRARMVSEGVQTNFPELAKIDKMSMEQGSLDATKIVESNAQDALQSLFEPQRANYPQKGFVYEALTIKAIQGGDVNMLMGLEKASRIIGTEAAQQLKSFDSNAYKETDVPRILKDVNDLKNESFVKQNKGKTVDEVKVKEIKSAEPVKAPSRMSWDEFINSIEC